MNMMTNHRDKKKPQRHTLSKNNNIQRNVANIKRPKPCITGRYIKNQIETGQPQNKN